MISLKEKADDSKERKSLDNVLQQQKFYLIKENNVYKIKIQKKKNEIIINCKNYSIQYNNNDLQILTKSVFHTIDESYNFITNIFEENKATIKEIIIQKKIILLLKINNKENSFEMILVYNKYYQENNNIFNIFDELKKDINNFKNEIKILKKEVNILKTFHYSYSLQEYKDNIISSDKEPNIEFSSNPKDIQYLINLTKDSYTHFNLDNTFTVFKSINKILYLIYANENNSIIAYNLIDNKKMMEIKNSHDKYITNFRHYLDKINKRDLIISISDKDNNIKIWNINDWNCILNIKNIYKNGGIDSVCFLNDNNKNYIITSNDDCKRNPESIAIFDFKGKKLKEIKDSNYDTYYIDTYYDNKLSKNFIITGNDGYVKSYDYNSNRTYFKYCDYDNKAHLSIKININEDIVKMIESSLDGNIRIWNFHSGLLLKKIKVNNYGLFGICLWNRKYLFVGSDDNTIKLIELKNGKVIMSLTCHNNYVVTIKKIYHPKYGECFISQGLKNEQIKLWKNKI